MYLISKIYLENKFNQYSLGGIFWKLRFNSVDCILAFQRKMSYVFDLQPFSSFSAMVDFF